MFPNFKSLADRERKRRALLASLAKEAEIDRIKQDAYELAEWASDAEKTLSLSTLSSKTTIGTQTDQAATIPVAQDISTANASVQATAPTAEVSVQAPPDDIGDENDSLSDIADMTDTSKLIMTANQRRKMNRSMKNRNLPDDQKVARYSIIQMYSTFPEIIQYRINPITVTGSQDASVYIGTNGELYVNTSNKRSRKPEYNFDWRATLAYINDIIDTKAAIPSEPISIQEQETRSTIEMDAYDMLKEILNTNELPIQPIPYKKGSSKQKKPISLGAQYRVNNDMKIIDGTGAVQKPRKDVSWANTLEQFVSVLSERGIPFKQSSQFRTSKTYTPSTNPRETNPDMIDAQVNISDRDFRQDVVQLYNDYPHLVDLFISPVPKTNKSDKPRYKDTNYRLAEYSKIVKANGSDLTEKQSNSLDKNTDWRATLSKIRDIDSTIWTGMRDDIVPRARRSSSMHMSELGNSGTTDRESMAGIGVAGLRGRRSMLKHEFDKLQGERGLGNDSRRVSRELKLIRRIF